MHPLRTPIHRGPPLVRRERSLPAADPARLLAALGGGARGFWGRGDRWVAWGGALARVGEITRMPAGRFDEVRRAVRTALPGDRDAWSEVPPAHRPRFFGGFSFLEAPGGDPAWTGFPSALFVLPRIVLEGTPEGVRAVVQAPARRGSGGEEEAGADRELDRVARHLDAGEDGEREPVPSRGRGASLGRSIDLSPKPPEGARKAWAAAVATVLEAISGDRVRKAVLSRFLDLELAPGTDPLRALAALREENPGAHVFLLEPRPGRVFLGAAPEILAHLRGGRFQATAVAGSMPRGGDAARDRELARRLLASGKDRAEHRLTVEEMIEVLGTRLEGMEVEGAPRVLPMARIQHLETTIRGRTAPGEDVLSLVEALHPTPAVCGRPRAAALELIRAAEPFDRGWYAGPVGWFDPAGDGDFVPALRSAVGGGGRWRLFAGAGIVAGSEAVGEWEETALKLEPALRALGAGAGER